MTALVAFASRHGATEEIAARIAARVADSGTAVELRHVNAVETLDAYNAVVSAPLFMPNRGLPRQTGSSRDIATLLPSDRFGSSALARSEIPSV